MSDSLMPTYARVDLAFERGEGAYLYAADGRRYLDFAAGIAVNALGHAHPHLLEALTGQAQKLWHCSNLYRIPEGERLAERLCAATFAERVFFCNSGAEALECGFKVVRKYHDDNGQPDRYRVITCSGAFHGRTLATLSAAANPKYMDGFLPAVDGFDQVAFGNLNELRAAITDRTAAILVEPVQGEGGIRSASLDYLRALRNICDEFGLLLMLDEVQCGMGRSGRLFAYEWAEIAPDVMAVAKGLGGGFPIGACLTTAQAAAAMTAGTHGSTFGGNPLAMAVANAVLDVVLADGFLERVDAVARSLRRRLDGLVARYPKVLSEVRGAGLLLGLRCVVPNGEVLARLRAEGMLAVTAAENVLRLAPPLIIDDIQVDEAVAILERVCGNWAEAA
jgi:acetylornithine/N-succinyldiaminopimelate aminotransferase